MDAGLKAEEKAFLQNMNKIFQREENKQLCKTPNYYPDSSNKQRDLFASVKWLLVVGKFTFLIPCEGFNWERLEDFNFR